MEVGHNNDDDKRQEFVWRVRDLRTPSPDEVLTRTSKHYHCPVAPLTAARFRLVFKVSSSYYVGIK